MFETAELGHETPKSEWKERVPALREGLLEAQVRLRELGLRTVVLFAGVDGAGKGETANLLNEWMDPHLIVTRAFTKPTREERERPYLWRFWRDMPARGEIGIFLSAWYSQPLLDHVRGRTSPRELDDRLEQILSFERTLMQDGVLVLKFWMHLSKQAQEARFKSLEADPLQKWRVTKRDWKHWHLYEDFVRTGEHIIARTSRGGAPWKIVEGADHRYRSLTVGEFLLDSLQHHVSENERRKKAPAGDNGGGAEAERPEAGGAGEQQASRTVLSSLEMSKTLEAKEYREQLARYQARLSLLQRTARERKISTIVVMEGWDAAGKGGAIRRMVAALEARDYQVITITKPTDEEYAHHYMWRFWRHLPRAGRFTVFDRSWYGRVLVERIEGFATTSEWRRAYGEINDFERQLVRHGIVLAKFWIHITPEEQERRFERRRSVAYKRWKLTPEDWRNSERWHEYELAVHDMIERTSTPIAPWHLIEGNDKRYARVRILHTLCDALEKSLEARLEDPGAR
jgi:polyphosphate:AMP phosphotransferase